MFRCPALMRSMPMVCTSTIVASSRCLLMALACSAPSIWRRLSRSRSRPRRGSTGGGLKSWCRCAVRLLDNIIDVSRYPLPAQEKEAKAKRRIGLGVTGLADALILCGEALRLGGGPRSCPALDGEDQPRGLCGKRGTGEGKGRISALRRGPVPASGHFPARCRPPSRGNQESTGMQERRADLHRANGHDFAAGRQCVERDRAGFRFRIPPPHPRRRTARRTHETVRITPCGCSANCMAQAPLPDAFVTAHELSPQQHLLMQAALQQLCRRVDFEDR